MSMQGTSETEPETRRAPRARALRRDEPSTHRMSVDEVRAFIRQFEPEPPPQVAFGPHDADEDADVEEVASEREPPTLLYRGRRRTAARIAGCEPGTLLGLGAASWLETVRPLTPGPRGPRAGSSGSAGRPDHTVASVENVTTLRSLPAHRKALAARSVLLWRGRARWAAGALALLILTAPLLLFALRERDDDASEPEATRPLAQPRLDARVGAAPGGTLGAEGATQERMDDVRRASALMMTGDSAGALEAFRVLSRAWPEHPALSRVVRLLEHELRACAAQGGAACR